MKPRRKMWEETILKPRRTNLGFFRSQFFRG